MYSAPKRVPSWTAVALRALLYALLVTVVVLYAPSEPHEFIYWGF